MGRMKRTHAVGGVLAVCALAAITATYVVDRAGRGVPRDPIETVRVASEPGTKAGAGGDVGRLEVIPFDSANQVQASNDPLLPRFDGLAKRARAGDTKAALQLHADLRQCIEGQRLLKEAAGLSRPAFIDARFTPLRQSAPVDVEKAEALLERAEDLLTLCDGIAQEALRSAGDWLLMAAEGGDVEAILTYAAIGGPDSYTDDPPISYAEELVRYKQRAGELLHAAARACDLSAVSMLQGVYWSGTFFPRDQVRSLAYFRIGRLARDRLEEAGANRMEELYSAGLEDDQINAARAMALRFVESNCR